MPRLAYIVLSIWWFAAAYAATSNPAISVTALSGAAEEIPATLMTPEGAGPFPAIVIMHDCSGLGPRSSGGPARWAQELLAQGYLILMPDSFATRGFPNGVCADSSPQRAEVGPYRRVRDAYAALAYLRTLAHVDGSRVGLMGGSHGGTTTLATVAAAENDSEPIAQAKRSGFAAAVALYPGCTARFGSWGPGAKGIYKPVAPLTILSGEKDDWTPAEPCRKLAESARDAVHPVTIKVYPDAHHSFDNEYPVRYVATRVNPNAPGGRGATTGGNAEAWADSKREVIAFFGRVMSAKK